MPHFTGRIDLVALDIDGTLLTKTKSLSPFTSAEIRRIGAEHGIPVVLMSSRMPTAIERIRDALHASPYYAAYSGALTCLARPEGDERLFERVLSKDVVELAVALAGEHDLNVGLYADRHWWTSGGDHWALREVRDTGVWPEVTATGRPRAIPDDQVDHVHKVALRGEPGKLAAAAHALRDAFEQSVDVNDANDNMAEVTPADGGKLRGLSAVCEHAGIAIEHVLAVGDGGVDVETVRAAAWGVAVQNATPELIEAARERTLSNDDDGVGLILRKYFPTGEAVLDFS